MVNSDSFPDGKHQTTEQEQYSAWPLDSSLLPALAMCLLFGRAIVPDMDSLYIRRGERLFQAVFADRLSSYPNQIKPD